MNIDVKKVIGKIFSVIKKISPKVWIVILCLAIVCGFIYSLNFRIHAKATGGTLGETSGTLAGRAVGSLDGLTRGQIEGYEAGKEAGLSAEDITAELATKIQEEAKLEVLAASGTYADVFTIGGDTDKYAALLTQKYNAVFTVNLETADIELQDDGLHVLLDQPEVEFYLDGETEKKAEFQKSSKQDSTEDGYKSLNNFMNQMPQKAKSQLQSDPSLMKAARNSAETQIKQLVNAISLTKPNVTVEFREGNLK